MSPVRLLAATAVAAGRAAAAGLCEVLEKEVRPPYH
jgi:hypothetical protein